MSVELPAGQVQLELDRHLHAAAAQPRTDGFGPGDAPTLLAEQLEASVRQEALEELARQSFQEAAGERHLRVAGAPEFQVNAWEAGQSFHYVATFQVCPEITIAGVETIHIRRPLATVEHADLEKMIEVIRGQHQHGGSGLPPLDSDFIKKFGIPDGSLEKFRTEVRRHMLRELHHTIQSNLKAQVLDGLVQLHDFEVPRALLADEIRSLRKQGTSDTDESIESLAAHEIKLRLLLGAIVREEKLQPDPLKVAARLGDLASTCTDPAALIAHYRGNPEAMRAIEEAVLEEQVVDWVMGKAIVTDVLCDFDSVMQHAWKEEMKSTPSR